MMSLIQKKKKQCIINDNKAPFKDRLKKGLVFVALALLIVGIILT